MSDVEFSASDRRSEILVTHNEEKPERQILAMRPESFFSFRFRMQVEKEETDKQGHTHNYQKYFNRAIDINILLMILFIGLPVLVYSMLP